MGYDNHYRLADAIMQEKNIKVGGGNIKDGNK